MPEVAVKPRPDEPGYVRSYVFTRFSIGLLGFLLPLALVLLEPALFDGLPAPRGSLSAYYYSGLRELFVGGLWAIGVFLVVYKFLDFSWESLLSSLAGAAAVLVAVFPTERPGDGVTLTPFQVKFGESTVTAIHYGAAVAFIALLIPIVLFFARDEGKRNAPKLAGLPHGQRRVHPLRRRPRCVRGHHGRAGQGSPLRRVDRDLGLRAPPGSRRAPSARCCSARSDEPALAPADRPPESPTVPG